MRCRTRCGWRSMRRLWRRTVRRSARVSAGEWGGDSEVDAVAALSDFAGGGLIRGERRGVEMHNMSRCAEVEKMYPGLIGAIARAHEMQMKRAKGKKVGKKRR